MGYSKISVLALMTALGTSAFFGGSASAQQYSPVSVNSDVQVNWDVADGYGAQPTVPQYLSPTVSREHIAMPGGDLIYPETRPRSEFLADNQFNTGGYGDGFETVVIDGAGGNSFPTQSQFYGVPGGTMSSSMDDGANQTIALNRPAPTAPRTKPAAPRQTESAYSSDNAPKPLTKPAPEPAPEPVSSPAPAPKPTQTETASAPVTAPAAPKPEPSTDTAMVEPPKAPPLPSEDTKAPAPSAPVVEPLEPSSNTPVAPTAAPDTTTEPTQMAEAAPKPAPKPTPEPAAEEASIPPATKAPVPSTSSGAGEYSLGFASDSFELTNAARNELNEVIAAMNDDDNLRIQLQAYAEGDGANASKARRLSLSRALQVRSYLIDQGVRSTRIDVRALGANVPSGPADRVDIKTVQR
ncbi:OmpA family protein [Thalassospira lucentensis]|uniref:OmpA family protein n=1 Tax=Thalassospira lucentensis TaxID=168935 RepID=UPI0026DD75A1|nr:OmpA family protein [Thalassospira lucentensis]